VAKKPFMRVKGNEWNGILETFYLSTFPACFASCAGTPQIR
jgi:hypothetical protein